ncbi:MAG: HNH endonuclease [Dokdonella sp.]
MKLLENLPAAVREPVATLLAELIRRASAHGPEHWGITDHGSGVRLNVGWTEIAPTMEDGLRLIVGSGARSERLSPAELIEGEDGRGFYPTIPGSLLAILPYLPADQFLSSIEVLRPALFDAVDLAARRSAGRGVRKGHSQALVGELALLLGEDLPAPEYESEHSTRAQGGIDRMEGALVRVVTSRYERDKIARLRCIEHYGAACWVCEFSFERVYGELGAGFIHVHHIVPLADIRGEYRVDPIRDLRPVCPNCHSMLHCGKETLSIDDLRARFIHPA